MRNIDYKDDQFVYRFINSDQCRTIKSLFDFLKTNNLPVRERWVFYLFGKFDLFDESTIVAMEDKDLFGAYYYDEVYFWSRFLENEHEKRREIRNEISIIHNDYLIRIKELKEEIEELEHNIGILNNCSNDDKNESFSIEGLLIQNTIKLNDLRSEFCRLNNMKLDNEGLNIDIQKKFVEEGYKYVKSAIENYFSQLESKAYFDFKNKEPEYININSNFCEACQESPCRCSDPDPN